MTTDLGRLPSDSSDALASRINPFEQRLQLGQSAASAAPTSALQIGGRTSQRGRGCSAQVVVQRGSGAPGGLTHQEEAQRREQLKAKRRVRPPSAEPPELSCDLARRGAASASGWTTFALGPPPAHDGGDDGEGLTPCKSAIEAGIQCVTTMPRKHRIYGSVESLDRRDRAIRRVDPGPAPPAEARNPTGEEVIADRRELELEMPAKRQRPRDATDNGKEAAVP
ncbi:hypothetical protein PG987_016592 [Apiospora arundinis]